MALLDVKNLSVSYRNFKILDNITFSLLPGEMLAIIGPNGSGKTTLLRSILGLKKFHHGCIQILGENIPKIIKRNTGMISYLPQHHDSNLLLPLTVYDVIAQGLKARKIWNETLNKGENEKIEELLFKVDLWHKKDELFVSLSGGQKKRALLALSLVNSPHLLFLDEPTNALDFSSIDKIYRILADIKSQGVGIVIISHDISSIVSSADTIAVLMNSFQYYGTPHRLPEEVIHRVFGAHIKIIPDEPSCEICNFVQKSSECQSSE